MKAEEVDSFFVKGFFHVEDIKQSCASFPITLTNNHHHAITNDNEPFNTLTHCSFARTNNRSIIRYSSLDIIKVSHENTLFKDGGKGAGA